jgi:hypothetical protein
MTLLVRNEDDIIEENLLFHKGMGVDFFVVADHLSTDCTPEILQKYKEKGWLDLWHLDSEIYDQGKWVSDLARKAYIEHKADWVINNDADEFWVPEKGTLKQRFEALDPSIGALHVNRLDFHYRPFNQAKFYEVLLFREWRCRWTKCCHRGASDVTVEIGNHHAYSKELSDKKLDYKSAYDSLRVLHFPVRSYERYRNKMIESTKFVLQTPGLSPSTAFHWKNALRHIENGTFEEFFKEMVYTEEKILQGLRDNSITIDCAIQRFFLNKEL